MKQEQVADICSKGSTNQAVCSQGKVEARKLRFVPPDAGVLCFWSSLDHCSSQNTEEHRTRASLSVVPTRSFFNLVDVEDSADCFKSKQFATQSNFPAHNASNAGINFAMVSKSKHAPGVILHKSGSYKWEILRSGYLRKRCDTGFDCVPNKESDPQLQLQCSRGETLL